MGFDLKAVLFDLDGVLVDSPLDLAAIKKELFGDDGIFIIEGLEALEDEVKKEKSELLKQRELEAAEQAIVEPSTDKVFEWLERNGIVRGVITRNCRDVVELIIDKFNLKFDVVIAREDAPPKPDPECVYKACQVLGVEPENSVMVGDFVFDIEAGKNAGCRTVFLETEQFRHLETGATMRIKNLEELIEVLETWTTGRVER